MSWTKFFRVSTAAVFISLVLSGCFEDIIPLKVGSSAPPATLSLLNGAALEVTDHPGKGQILTFMSSWCPCSNDSIPMMKKAYGEHGQGQESKISFLMIGIQDPESKFRAFVEKWDIPFPTAYDDGDEVARTYGIKQPPTTVFVDKDGKIQRVFYGNIKDKEQEFYQWTKELL